MNKDLEINATIQIGKSPEEVFQAIVDPNKMSNYFISESTGKMESGKTVIWKFPEFDVTFPVKVLQTKAGEFISFNWDNENKETLVEIKLEAAKNSSTVVRISERSMANDEAGIRWLKSNTEGWANFLACLKAYLEFGINLRKGGFDFMDKPDLS
ncbi:MAG: ATPase [Bacteroidetes bacterium]|nr:MAG: ATPase [Bacteroidota bacterium]REK05700.1 MAG: ATPase [Bacteroidota bacterium]REK31994.1 MAG: ATPase [Bacteroidota bacterium]REK50058.1 MAG: ATPase [Bacteroidota bacterium]